MQKRIGEGRIQYVRNRQNEGNELIKFVITKLEENQGPWKRYSERQCNKIGLLKDSIHTLSKKEITMQTRKKDTAEWKEEMDKKTTLKYYRKFKKEIRQEVDYLNDRRSDLWYQARTNCLYLGDRKREDSACKLCNEEREDFSHMLLHCEKLSEERLRSIQLQRPHIENEEDMICDFLNNEEEVNEKMEVLQAVWNKRDTLIRALNPNA